MKAFIGSFSKILKDRKRMETFWRASVLCIVILGILIPLGFAEAADLKMAISYVMMIFANVLQWIVSFVGKLVVMLIDVLIQIASYNNFVNSKPVQTGWPLVRDITNMFFIVILLVIAFSTIVHWNKFPKSLLPKLLLMAVLVNFSLTLLGLAIDFSQVIMLTFVNGFKAAAAGNFVIALGLDKMMKIEQSPVEVKDNESLPVKLIASLMLAIFFLTMTAVLMMIMVLYLVVRIVGLWLILIMSPLGFFATALPGNITGKIPEIGTFWDKFGALMVGGPIMAFFLWLTLAVAQGGLSEDISSSMKASGFAAAGETQAVATYFETAISNVESVATFFIAYIMLLMGVNAAITVSKQVSPQLEAAAGKVKSAGMGAAKFAAYGGAAMLGGFAAQQAYRGGKAVAGATATAIDRRYDVSGRVGRSIQQVGLATGMTGLAAQGAQLAGTRARARKAEAAKLDKAMEGLGVPAKMAVYESYAKSGNADRRKMGQEKFLKGAVTGEGMSYLAEKQEQAATQAADREGITDEAERRAFISSYQQQEARKSVSDRIAEYQKEASSSGDEDGQKWAKETLEKNPDLLKETAEKTVTSHVANLVQTDEANVQKMSMTAFQDTRVLDGIISGSGMIGADGKIDEANPAFKKYTSGTGTRNELIRRRLQELAEQAGEDQNIGRTIREAEHSGRYEKVDVAREGEQPRKEWRFTPSTQVATAAARAGEASATDRGSAVSRQGDIAEGQRALDRSQARLQEIRADRAMAPEARMAAEQQIMGQMDETRRGMMQAGASMAEAYRVEPQGTFASDEDRNAFGAQIEMVQQQGDQDVSVYQQMDVSMLQQNPRGNNEARSTFVQHASVDSLRDAYQAADQSGDKVALSNITTMAEAIETEGKKVESQIDSFNSQAQKFNEQAARQGISDGMREGVVKEEVLEAGRQFMSATTPEAKASAQENLQRALGSSGLQMSIQDAVAMAKKEDVRGEPVLHAATHAASRKASAALDRISRTTSDVAAGVSSRVSSAASSVASAASTAGSTVASGARGAASRVGAAAGSAGQFVSGAVGRAVGREAPEVRSARIAQRSEQMSARLSGRASATERRQQARTERAQRAATGTTAREGREAAARYRSSTGAPTPTSATDLEREFLGDDADPPKTS